MINLFKWIFLTLLWVPELSFAQLADFSLDEFFEVGNSRTLNPSNGEKIEASARFISDGHHLSLAVKVKDPHITINPNPRQSDQVHVWLALPKSAYPEDFEYAFHPHYITNHYGQSRGGEGNTGRSFSIDSEHANQLNKRHFLEKYDYPLDNSIIRDKMNIPTPRELHVETFDYGIVQYAFYPDQRSPRLINQDEINRVGESLGIKIADLTSEIKYFAEYTDHGDGYIINVQFNTRSLGFAPFPSLGEIRLMVDILNVEQDGLAQVVQSSSPARQEGKPATFNPVSFAIPLYTNESDIPDYLFEDAENYPVCIFSESGWIPTLVDVDNLVYGEKYISKELMEVKFLYLPLTYERWDYQGVAVESLNFEYFFVNQLPKEINFTRVNDHLIRSERILGITSEPLPNLPPRWFKFPDNSTGMITHESYSLHPFGWGICGTCMDERFTIHRIDSYGTSKILNIFQGDGEDAYCQIENLLFKDFYVSDMDWTTEGKTLVIRLKHRFLKEKKRVMANWEDDGSHLEVILLD